MVRLSAVEKIYNIPIDKVDWLYPVTDEWKEILRKNTPLDIMFSLNGIDTEKQ